MMAVGQGKPFPLGDDVAPENRWAPLATGGSCWAIRMKRRKFRLVSLMRNGTFLCVSQAS